MVQTLTYGSELFQPFSRPHPPRSASTWQNFLPCRRALRTLPSQGAVTCRQRSSCLHVHVTFPGPQTPPGGIHSLSFHHLGTLAPLTQGEVWAFPRRATPRVEWQCASSWSCAVACPSRHLLPPLLVMHLAPCGSGLQMSPQFIKCGVCICASCDSVALGRLPR